MARTVPTSPTFVSLNEKKHELELEINRLKSAREVAGTQAREAMDALDALRNDSTRISSKLDELAVEAVRASEIAAKAVTESFVAVREAQELTGGYVALISSLRAKADECVAEAERAKESVKQSHESIVKETEHLLTAKSDLDIYRKRLETHYAEHLPGQKVHL